MNCARCPNPICRENKSGLCRVCFNADPAMQAKRAEGIRRAFMDPVKRERQRKAVAAANKRPERRARSGELAKALKLWESGLPKITGEVRAVQGKTCSANRMAHIPADYLDLYRELTRVRRLPAGEALAVVLDQQERDLAQFRTRIGAG